MAQKLLKRQEYVVMLCVLQAITHTKSTNFETQQQPA